jgi:thiol-disulfide isomerase/thioredoxin
MAVESSGNLIGYQLPAWELPDIAGAHVQVREEGHQATLVAFVCNHCPYVKHVETAFGELAARYAAKGLRTLAVVSNNVAEFPDDDVPGMTEQVSRAGWGFPYLQDLDQRFAKELGAVCTPDFFLFDAGLCLTYRGAFDESSPKNGNPVNGSLLDQAITHTLAGDEVPLPHRPAMGCGIKWLPGMEPEAS